ncbi:hypothetical protein RSSM_02113 [Rhodopirellula sallentina SM41]|uniref:Uncharacterized protein n=1 Tax=Rhodopirellula sallentina SM41 TaxID=1263870 RepID=M5U5B4_9BACT|nr:hypothetical protein RSSM_02113 [Rhodopirellula sallentina SM41]
MKHRDKPPDHRTTKLENRDVSTFITPTACFSKGQTGFGNTRDGNLTKNSRATRRIGIPQQNTPADSNASGTPTTYRINARVARHDQE